MGRNFIGAFADGAILFPLIVVLCVSSGFTAWILLLSVGLAYIISGWVFRIPMPVQPLKSIAIAAVAVGATSMEVRWSGAILGLVLTIAAFVPAIERGARRIPVELIHALQLGLGVLLIGQALKVLRAAGVTFSGSLSGDELVLALGSLTAAAFFLVGPRYVRMPVLGIAATLGFIYAIFSSEPSIAGVISHSMQNDTDVRVGMIASLVLPQIALTFFNSVLGTAHVAREYYGEAAARVTLPRLMKFIGFGNLLAAGVGGLPFCHGSGGLTAHYRGGATHWMANVFIGVSLLVLALVAAQTGAFSLQYPTWLLAALLLAVGCFHILLARPTWKKTTGKALLVVSFAAAAVTQNMLIVLVVASGIKLLTPKDAV